MNSEKRHIGWLLGSMLMLLLLVACSEDSSDVPQGSPVQLLSVTRASSRFTPEENSNIKMYVTTRDALFSEGSFSYNSGWTNSGVSVGEHAQYYIYGYMPGNIASSSGVTKPQDGDFSGGADLTLTGMPMFTAEDVCVIVGVRKVTDSSDEIEAAEGNYGYLSGLAGDNYVNLLMDHLYSQLILQFNIDATYNELRHIKLKAVTLTSTFGEKVDARIKFRAGNSLDVNSVVYSKTAGSAAEKVLNVLESTDAVDFLTTTASNTSFGPFNCAPCTFDANGTNLTLTCTYDVYNTAGTKVLRANCTATNKLKVTSMDHGVQKTITLTIAPTYLYTLSDDDLNNPTVKIQ